MRYPKETVALRSLALRALRYNEETGLITWQASRGNRAAGSAAGAVFAGRRVVQVGGQTVYAHRLAWLLAFGDWPQGEVDHLDGDAMNNRLTNLRLADRSLNMQNQRRARRDNGTGFLGVSRTRYGRFAAAIKINGRRTRLGNFETPIEAHAAYLRAKRQLHPGGTL